MKNLIDIPKDPIVEKCEGCTHTKKLSGEGRLMGLFTDRFCDAYLYPYAKWRLGPCPMADNIPKVKETEAERQKRQFAGKRTDTGAIKGALGYNPFRGKAKG